jgi:hypothetical protein
MFLPGSASCRTAETGLYANWDFNGLPGFAWENYLTWGNRGTSDSIGATVAFLYYTRTGLIGTNKDWF